jgi:hypothetical protein
MVASSACIKKAMAAIHGNPAILRAFFSVILCPVILPWAHLASSTEPGRPEGIFPIAFLNRINSLMQIELYSLVLSDGSEVGMVYRMKQRSERDEKRISTHRIDMFVPGHINFNPAFTVKVLFQIPSLPLMY